MKEGIKNAKANELDAAQIHFHHRTPPPRLLAFKNNPFLQTSLNGLHHRPRPFDPTRSGLMFILSGSPGVARFHRPTPG